jgi:ketosteroid isomerase-like protein
MQNDALKWDEYVTLSKDAFAFFEGNETDRRDILAMHRAYLDANSNNLNAEDLRKIWSDDPRCVWFNGTGYNYYGIEDWLKLWTYFRARTTITEPWRSTDVHLIGDGKYAVVTSIRTTRGSWTSDDQVPDWVNKNWRSRSTEVFRKKDGVWKCIHIHVSTEPEGVRFEQREK